MVNGVPSLDTDRKVPIDELRDATTESKGIVQLTDSVTSNSTTTAATPNSVKIVYDALNTEKNRLNNVENKSSATIRSEITKSNVTNALGYTPYTPNEVDNKLSALEPNIDWKESVNTFNDIASIYPNPQDGWTVNVKDTDYTYRYNGNEWVAISANAIPKATNNIDGLLSKEDHTNYDDANSKKHTHHNKSVLDSITEDAINNMNNITAHTHDDRYYTESEVDTKLAGKAASNHTHAYAASGHTHDERYYTETEVNNLLSGKANSSHTHTKSQITDFPSSLPANDVYGWAKAKNKPTYTWNEIDSKPSTFTPSTHNHDDRYYTESEVDTKLAGKAASNHTHNYLSLSGGTMNGTLKIPKTAQLQMENWGFHAEYDQMLKIIPKEGDFTMTFGVTDSMWTFAPWKNGMYQLGSPNHKFGNVYANNGTIVTSDRNKKTDIKDISNKYLDFFSLLQPVTYRFKGGSSGRIHVGFISQDVETAMNQTGLSDLDFAGFCKDKKRKEIVIKHEQPVVDDKGNELLDENGNLLTVEYDEMVWEDELDENNNPLYVYSLRYEEFIALNTAVIQKQQRQIEDLEKRLEKLEKVVYC